MGGGRSRLMSMELMVVGNEAVAKLGSKSTKVKEV